MKHFLRIFCILSLFASISLYASGGEQKLPDWKGPESGPAVLFLHGGRPWQARINGSHLVESGARVLNITGTYLDGFGGAPIREHMAFKDEPTPFDGITPAFKEIKSYNLIIVNAIPQDCLNQLFTPERIDAVKQFVSDGGNVLFCERVPQAFGAEFLPVMPNSPNRVFGKFSATRLAGKAFDFYPEGIPVPQYYKVSLLPEAELLSAINDPSQTPFVAMRKYGNGAVYYFNSPINKDTDSSALHTFASWAYANSFYVSLVNLICDTSLNAEKFLQHLPDIPARVELGDIEVDVSLPELGVTEETASPVKNDEWSVTFANGCRLSVVNKKTIQIFYPGEDTPLLRDFNVPKISYAAAGIGYNTATNERDVNTETVRTIRIRWKLQSLTVEGADAVLTYTGKDAEMQWRFRAGKMQLDGREFQGVSDSVAILKCPSQLGGITITGKIRGDNALLAPRNSCYLPPRGFAEFKMDGSVSSNTGLWSFFGSGQPFEMLTFENGVYFGAIDAAYSTEVSLARDKGDSTIESARKINLGKINAPCRTVPYWHWYGKGAVRPHHDFMAMYQFQRQNLRRKAGLDELPAVPMASDHYVSADEHRGLLKLAKEKGYRYFEASINESPIDSLIGKAQLTANKLITDAGMGPRNWSAGSYCQGDTWHIYKEHPEWFVYGPDGKIYCYGGNHYPVLDINNKEFFQWYCDTLTKAVKEGGLKILYRDMDGTAADCVNYATPESPQGLPIQIKYYRFLEDLGVAVQIEGQNPLVLDVYWYRSNLYARNFPGNEYVLVGSMPSASADIYGGVEMDAFRLGMYDCFISYNQGPIYMELDIVPGSLERGRRGMELVERFNQALDATGMPYVRETPFGTSWTGPKGGALFFWNPVKKVTLKLPKGWKIKGIEGNVLSNVPGDAIYLLEKAN